MIIYKPIFLLEKGTIQKILKTCYQDFFFYFPNEKRKLYGQWEKEDEDAFNNTTIGEHTLFTCVDDIVIGYCSWDDRNFPYGIIGQNCIIPSYQNQGYGKKQITVIEEKLKQYNFKEISVLTGDHKFFLPAQKMYLACGFRKKKISNGVLFKNIEFYKLI